MRGYVILGNYRPLVSILLRQSWILAAFPAHHHHPPGSLHPNPPPHGAPRAIFVKHLQLPSFKILKDFACKDGSLNLTFMNLRSSPPSEPTPLSAQTIYTALHPRTQKKKRRKSLSSRLSQSNSFSLIFSSKQLLFRIQLLQYSKSMLGVLTRFFF